MSDDATRTRDALASRVRDFYERHPYPPAKDDIEPYRRAWDDERRRTESLLLWPSEPCRDDRSVLVAGCGTMQAAHYAVRWPNARVVGIDVSETSIASSAELKAKYSLDNLELRQLGVERAGELGEIFDHIVCTGVLHHLPDPDAGLHALRQVLTPSGSLHLMVYAPYGRAGIYMLQEYCRRIGAGTTEAEVRDLASTMRALPQDHPIVPLLRTSPDFSTTAGLADALLHPNDRAYAVPQLFDLLEKADFTFARWVRQAPYLPSCGAIAGTPHAKRLTALELVEQYAAMELFRGAMARHSVIACGTAEIARAATPAFDTDAWLRYIPVRLTETIEVRENLPPGASAVLINRMHAFTDLYLPIDAPQERVLAAIDGKRTVADIVGTIGNSDGARLLFEQLWLWDQIVFDR